MTASKVDKTKLEQFMGQVVTDAGAAMNSVLVLIGDELGLWKAMEGAGLMTTSELAGKTGVTKPYIRGWISSQAASGYVEFDAGDRRVHAVTGAGHAFRQQ